MTFLYRAWNFYLDFLNANTGACLFLTGMAIIFIAAFIEAVVFEPRRFRTKETR